MRDLTLYEWLVLSFSITTLILGLIMLLLWLMNKTKYLKHWTLSWLVLSFAYVVIFLAEYFDIVSILAISVLVFPVSSYYIYRGNLRFLSKNITQKSNLVLLAIVLILPLLTTFDPSGVSTLFFLFFTLSAYMMITAPYFIARDGIVDKLYGITLVIVALFNFFYPFLIVLNIPTTAYTVASGFFGFIIGLLMIFVHYQSQQVRLISRQNELYYKSYHDSLTDLYNRAYLEDTLRYYDEDETALPVSIIVADLNKLKIINDNHGHDFGDKMLQSIAKIFKDFCDSEDTIVRYGGDEFVIVLPRTDYEDAVALSVAIVRRTKSIRIKDVPLDVAMGVATKTSLNKPLHHYFIEAEKNMYTKK